MQHHPSPLFRFRALLLSLSAGILIALPLIGASCSLPRAQFEDVNALGGGPPPGVVGVNVVASCPIPTPGGPIDSASVAVGDRNDLRVILTAPAPVGGTLIELTSQDPTIANAGDPRQGFVTQVFVPEGGQVSNSFDIFGVKVGLTQITGQDLTSQFVVLSLTVVVWDLGNGGTERLYDANTPNGNHCRNIDTSPNLSQDPNKLAVCGRRVKGVVADGVSNLLLRTRAGLAGTVCFDVLPTSAQDLGSITDSVVTTQSVAGTNQATSFYTAPADYEDPRPRRFVDLEAVFIPSTGNPSPSRLTTRVEVVAPPTVVIHGVWSERGGWSVAYEDRTDSFRTVTLADYKPTNQREFANNTPRIRAFLDKALIFQRLKGYAATQADVVAHSMGGILTRHHMLDPGYPTPDTYGQGDVNKLVLLDSPQLGSNLANALIRIHSVSPKKAAVIGKALGGRPGPWTR